MVRMRYGSTLDTFGEHKRSPNIFQCIWVHLESIFALQMYPVHYHNAYKPYLWSLCTMVVHWVHLESKYALQMHPIALECIWRAPMLSKYTQCATIAHTDHKYGPYALW